MNTLEQNKRLVRRHYEEVLSQKRLDIIEELYSDPIQIGDEVSMPRAQFSAMAGMMMTIFPDVQVTVRDQVAEGDKVVSRWTAIGIHQGDFLGVAPTGKRVTIKAIHIHQIKDGRICALWEEIDLLGLRQQLSE